MEFHSRAFDQTLFFGLGVAASSQIDHGLDTQGREVGIIPIHGLGTPIIVVADFPEVVDLDTGGLCAGGRLGHCDNREEQGYHKARPTPTYEHSTPTHWLSLTSFS